MPVMWFAKDGRRPYTQQGPGVSILYEEIKGAFEANKAKYVSREPPEFNVDSLRGTQCVLWLRSVKKMA